MSNHTIVPKQRSARMPAWCLCGACVVLVWYLCGTCVLGAQVRLFVGCNAFLLSRFARARLVIVRGFAFCNFGVVFVCLGVVWGCLALVCSHLCKYCFAGHCQTTPCNPHDACSTVQDVLKKVSNTTHSYIMHVRANVLAYMVACCPLCPLCPSLVFLECLVFLALLGDPHSLYPLCIHVSLV